MGDTHRIPRCKDKKLSDIEFAQLLHIDPNRLSRNYSRFFTSPAYAYTKAEVGGIHNELPNL